jgi:hypothetical protein
MLNKWYFKNESCSVQQILMNSLPRGVLTEGTFSSNCHCCVDIVGNLPWGLKAPSKRGNVIEITKLLKYWYQIYIIYTSRVYGTYKNHSTAVAKLIPAFMLFVAKGLEQLRKNEPISRTYRGNASAEYCTSISTYHMSIVNKINTVKGTAPSQANTP